MVIQASNEELKTIKHRPLVTVSAGIFMCITALGTPGVARAGCPVHPRPTVSSSTPSDVCIPKGFNQLPIEFFDDYSWRAFIAMVWPANRTQRGVPDNTKTRPLADPGQPLVFETLKSEWEIFNGSTNPEPHWNVVATPNPCGVRSKSPADLVLGTFSFSKFGNLGQAAFGSLVGPLVAQNRTYVRYSTGFNRSEFDQIIRDKLFLSKNQAANTFQPGALDVKAAWLDMTGLSPAVRQRYYTRPAIVFEPTLNKCVIRTMGLIGLHIVQKTPSRPQWIWTSFEQVDNVPPPNDSPMALNKGDGTPMPKQNPIDFDPNRTPPMPVQEPPPFNVERLKAIHTSTAMTNAAYQAALAGTPWRFYQLVVTQWPVPNPPTLEKVDPNQDGSPAHTFPGTNADGSAFANTTMETFDQNRVSRSCMACHNQTRAETDFVWALSVNGLSNERALRVRPNLPLMRLKALLSEK